MGEGGRRRREEREKRREKGRRKRERRGRGGDIDVLIRFILTFHQYLHYHGHYCLLYSERQDLLCRLIM